uniref:hypothetical protein n=1 Tax=Edaphosphingomonas laterariae TaxID=861865 RepID=UPI001181C1F2|nr:hypothetical protein [Sphingomonas laterariae]
MAIYVPSAVLTHCLERETSVFSFEGPYLGEMSECHGLEAYEYGGLRTHAVSRLRLTFEADRILGQFRMQICGALSPIRQSNDEWDVPAPLSDFQIDAQFGFDEVASIFFGDKEAIKGNVDRALARLATSKSLSGGPWG